MAHSTAGRVAAEVAGRVAARTRLVANTGVVDSGSGQWHSHRYRGFHTEDTGSRVFAGLSAVDHCRPAPRGSSLEMSSH